MPTDHIFTEVDLTDLVTRIFRSAGLSPLQATAIARVIVAAERDGCTSHGVYRIAGILRTLQAGFVDPVAVPQVGPDDRTAIVRVDARNGFSNPAVDLGLPHLAERTRRFGVAALVVNDCTHFAALWPEVEALAGQGLASMAMCSSYASVAPAGGIRALLGTNPFAFGWPRRDAPPYVFDFATSVAARGEIELHRRAGTRLPEGWAVDAGGHPTTDPAEALAGAMLPFGGHKGSAIGTMIELLSSVMIGDRTSAEALGHLGSTTLLPRHGELVVAFDPVRFSAGRDGDALDRAETLFDAILGQGARLPSQRRYAARARAAADGIPLSQAEVSGLMQLLGRPD